MKRLFTILILLASCNGCMLFDDMAYYEPPMQSQPSSCAVPPIVQIAQTQEPPLLQGR
jgi:hypothetical protein